MIVRPNLGRANSFAAAPAGGLFLAGTNHLTVADVGGPCSTVERDILLAGKG